MKLKGRIDLFTFNPRLFYLHQKDKSWLCMDKDCLCTHSDDAEVEGYFDAVEVQDGLTWRYEWKTVFVVTGFKGQFKEKEIMW